MKGSFSMKLLCFNYVKVLFKIPLINKRDVFKGLNFFTYLCVLTKVFLQGICQQTSLFNLIFKRLLFS